MKQIPSMEWLTILNKNFPTLFIQNHGNWPDSVESGKKLNLKTLN